MESSELLRRLKAELCGSIQTPPPEWKTARQWSEEWGTHPTQTQRILREGIKRGHLTTQKFRIRGELRPGYPTPHYKYSDAFLDLAKKK
jgi:hypothetical protein